MKIKLLVLNLLLLSTVNFYGQVKKIKFKEQYIHSATKTEFPLVISNFKLAEVNAFDKKKENVCIDYQNDGSKISIFLYPASSGSENRLRSEYQNSIFAINYKNNETKKFDFKHVKIEKEKVIINGLKTSFIDSQSNKNSLLSIYECGSWFFKIRITSDLSFEEIELLEKAFIEKFDPTKLTLSKPLNLKGEVTLSNLATRDTLFLASNLGMAYKKLAWAIKNIDEKERISGLTDIYLDMHVQALTTFITIESQNNDSPTKKMILRRTPETGKLLDELKKINDAGFLEEYIFEAYDGIMLIPSEIKLNLDNYSEWKIKNEIPEYIFLKATRVSYEEN